MYTYIVLPKTPLKPKWQEYYVIVYVATLAIEKLRQVCMFGPYCSSLIEDFPTYFSFKIQHHFSLIIVMGHIFMYVMS